ncbi:YdgH/BhsA/McbA-like domain containing protein [Rahnella ecdela]|uniref:DUF1471 domain-containing protein n=1 Tax=Rahnella ecdela TaxID=2816250 RepID=A0ABS6LAN8_9GAMM|nr:YdgH/BhsA/McbA-like domain containing protein [Rahnella ecdela]MBU9843890.1 DUF1471 domain-containing protein [Rahnella ecdela]
MKKLMIAALLTFPVITFAAQTEQGPVWETQAGVLNVSQDAAGTEFVSGSVAENLNYNDQASLTGLEDISEVMIPSIANELNRQQAYDSVKVGEVSAHGAATPDDLDNALMVKAEKQGASGYRVTSVSNMSPYSGTATLYR